MNEILLKVSEILTCPRDPDIVRRSLKLLNDKNEGNWHIQQTELLGICIQGINYTGLIISEI